MDLALKMIPSVVSVTISLNSNSLPFSIFVSMLCFSTVFVMSTPLSHEGTPGFEVGRIKKLLKKETILLDFLLTDTELSVDRLFLGLQAVLDSLLREEPCVLPLNLLCPFPFLSSLVFPRPVTEDLWEDDFRVLSLPDLR